MGLRHESAPIFGVQFHPESVLTEGGYRMLGNWLAVAGLPEARERAVHLNPLVRTTGADARRRRRRCGRLALERRARLCRSVSRRST